MALPSGSSAAAYTAYCVYSDSPTTSTCVVAAPSATCTAEASALSAAMSEGAASPLARRRPPAVTARPELSVALAQVTHRGGALRRRRQA